MPSPTHAKLLAAMAAERIHLLLTEFDRLPDDMELNRAEAAVVINRSIATLKVWDKTPDHPIKWKRRGKQLSTTVGCVRAYQRMEQPRAKRGRPAKVTETAITT